MNSKDVVYEHCKKCDGFTFCIYHIQNNSVIATPCPCFEALRKEIR